MKLILIIFLSLGAIVILSSLYAEDCLAIRLCIALFKVEKSCSNRYPGDHPAITGRIARNGIRVDFTRN